MALVAWPTVAAQERAVGAYAELSAEGAGGERDWEALLGEMPSVVAWCEVDGTSIDLPVCQATDEDPGFWLTHDAWGEDSPAGAPT